MIVARIQTVFVCHSLGNLGIKSHYIKTAITTKTITIITALIKILKNGVFICGKYSIKLLDESHHLRWSPSQRRRRGRPVHAKAGRVFGKSREDAGVRNAMQNSEFLENSEFFLLKTLKVLYLLHRMQNPRDDWAQNKPWAQTEPYRNGHWARAWKPGEGANGTKNCRQNVGNLMGIKQKPKRSENNRNNYDYYIGFWINIALLKIYKHES